MNANGNYPDSCTQADHDLAFDRPMEQREYDAIISDETQWLMENMTGEELFDLFMNARHDSLLVKKIQDALELATETLDMHEEAAKQFRLYLGVSSSMFAISMDILVRGFIDDQWTRTTASSIGFAIENVVKDEIKSLAEYNYSNNCLKHGV